MIMMSYSKIYLFLFKGALCSFGEEIKPQNIFNIYSINEVITQT